MNLVRKLMSADEFLAWRQDQPGRWELVSGSPIQMMAGAKQRHDRIVINLIVTLAARLKGGPYRQWSADIATRTPAGNVRQPDVTIDCGPPRDEALESSEATVVFEVLSPSTRTFDQLRKVDEYKTVPTLQHIVLIDPDQPRIVVWTRRGGVWADIETTDLSASIALDAVKTKLALAEIYDDVKFEP